MAFLWTKPRKNSKFKQTTAHVCLMHEAHAPECYVTKVARMNIPINSLKLYQKKQKKCLDFSHLLILLCAKTPSLMCYHYTRSVLYFWAKNTSNFLSGLLSNRTTATSNRKQRVGYISLSLCSIEMKWEKTKHFLHTSSWQKSAFVGVGGFIATFFVIYLHSTFKYWHCNSWLVT